MSLVATLKALLSLSFSLNHSLDSVGVAMSNEYVDQNHKHNQILDSMLIKFIDFMRWANENAVFISVAALICFHSLILI